MQERTITVSKLFKKSICYTTDKCSDEILWTEPECIVTKIEIKGKKFINWMYEFVIPACTDLLTITYIGPFSAICHSNPSTALHWITMWKAALPTK